MRGVQWLVAITVVAELGDLTRFDSPRQLAAFVGLIPSEYSSGPSRRQGGITKAGNGRARRALIEGAWAYRHPAKVSEHIQRRIDALPKPIQDIGWKAQVRLCKRFRRLTARGKHPNVAVTAIARELIAFMWAIAKEVPVTAKRVTQVSGRRRGAAPVSAQPSTTLRGGFGRPSCLERGRRATVPSQVVPNPRISAGSTVGFTGSVSALTRVCQQNNDTKKRALICKRPSPRISAHLTTEVISTRQMSRALRGHGHSSMHSKVCGDKW